MRDAALVAFWVALPVAAGSFCVAARKAGVDRTYLRDLIHVGAGVWVLGWPSWSTRFVPIAFAIAAAAATFAVAPLAARAVLAGKVRDSIADEDERWSGVRLYAVSFAAGTVAGFTFAPASAAAALLALSLGDGLGGLIGRRWGRHFFIAPGAKRKSLEGSAAVGVFSAAGVAVAMLRFGIPLAPMPILAAAAVSILAEALAPRGTDNFILPASVWLVLTLMRQTGS
jgi:dolichol kinase